jgi:CspA family cold shock protein
LNIPELMTRSTYALLGVGSLAVGIWLIAEPSAAGTALHLQANENSGAQEPLLRRLGAGYAGAALALAWCVLAAPVRSRLHLGLLLFFGLLASLQIAELLAAGLPPAAWFAVAPFALLPPLLLLVMLLPLPAMPAMPSRSSGGSAGPTAGMESGTVKWFDGRKGFGFITRANGDELFVHYRSVSEEHGGSKALRDGQTVHFRVGQGKKGPQAENVIPVKKSG